MWYLGFEFRIFQDKPRQRKPPSRFGGWQYDKTTKSNSPTDVISSSQPLASQPLPSSQCNDVIYNQNLYSYTHIIYLLLNIYRIHQRKREDAREKITFRLLNHLHHHFNQLHQLLNTLKLLVDPEVYLTTT